MSEFNFVKGDRVRFDYWKPEQYAEILWVGTVLFAYISQDGIEKCMSKLHDWLPWIDPEATKDEPEALWRIITRWPEGDTFKESDFLYTDCLLYTSDAADE